MPRQEEQVVDGRHLLLQLLVVVARLVGGLLVRPRAPPARLAALRAARPARRRPAAHLLCAPPERMVRCRMAPTATYYLLTYLPTNLLRRCRVWLYLIRRCSLLRPPEPAGTRGGSTRRRRPSSTVQLQASSRTRCRRYLLSRFPLCATNYACTPGMADRPTAMPTTMPTRCATASSRALLRLLRARCTALRLLGGAASRGLPRDRAGAATGSSLGCC